MSRARGQSDSGCVLVSDILQFKGEHFWLSNFYMSAFTWKGLRWASGEHAFQAMKSRDPKIWAIVQKLRTPSEAKSFGRYEIELREDWEVVKIPTMAEMLEAKYSKLTLHHKLLATGNVRLSEGNWHKDDFWGVCLKTNQGQDWLGKLTMDLRYKKQLSIGRLVN